MQEGELSLESLRQNEGFIHTGLQPGVSAQAAEKPFLNGFARKI
jgi:hypothetical protein